MDENGHREIMELGHEPWAGFRRAFLIVFIVASAYLAALLFATIPGASGGDGHGSPTEQAP